jgi:hypothetical protein
MTMPRTYAAKRLLEHGALTFHEMWEITGWERSALTGVLRQLVVTETVTFRNEWTQARKPKQRCKTRRYSLTQTDSTGASCRSA